MGKMNIGTFLLGKLGKLGFFVLLIVVHVAVTRFIVSTYRMDAYADYDSGTVYFDGRNIIDGIRNHLNFMEGKEYFDFGLCFGKYGSGDCHWKNKQTARDDNWIVIDKFNGTREYRLTSFVLILRRFISKPDVYASHKLKGEKYMIKIKPVGFMNHPYNFMWLLHYGSLTHFIISLVPLALSLYF